MFSTVSLKLRWSRRKSALRTLAVLLALAPAPAGSAQPMAGAVVLTDLAQVRNAATQSPLVSHALRLEGTVWWSRAAPGRLVLADDSDAEALVFRCAGDWPSLGQRIRLTGRGTVTRWGADLQLGAVGPVVDNDGEHVLIEKSGAVELLPGLNPIRLEWFNGLDRFDLQAEYAGPGIPRQPIPASALFHRSSEGGPSAPGLSYACYEGNWQALPPFADLAPVASGVTSSFNLSVARRAEQTAVVFTGQLNVETPGLYQFHLRSDDGSRLFVGHPSLSVEALGDGQLPKARRMAAGQTWNEGDASRWAYLEGRVTQIKRVRDTTVLELESGAASLRVEIGDDSRAVPTALLGTRVHVEGFCQPSITSEGDRIVGTVLVPDWGHVQPSQSQWPDEAPTMELTSDSALPALTHAAQVHRLRREEAERGYPVRVRGVVTSVLPEHQAFTLHDATRGLYVEDLSEYRSRPPKAGEFLVVEGVTDSRYFAPIVNARHVRSLGQGQMPAAVKPTWDQLMNGSLDAQWVELQGIVTAVHSNSVSLLTRDGVVSVELRVAGMPVPELAAFENALVRIRGCLFASWDYVTHQVKMGEVRIYDADLLVDQPPPTDLFDSPQKTAAELLLFDPQAGAFQRVKVRGQVVHVRGTEHFMMDAGRGLRFELMKPEALEAGDEVEVAGFPELYGGASPVLREAVARKIGRRPLPPATPVSAQELVAAVHDSTRVRVEGRLAGVRRGDAEQVLEIQSGVRSFVARLASRDDSLVALPVGALLELHGVYAGHGVIRPAGSEVAGFELLLNAASDVRLLARPPWWTLKRLLVIVGLLACVLAATILWVTQLRRQVEQRSAELAAQIKEREHAEQQRAIEQERARIAQDLHDELGSGITEISMLAARARAVATTEERRAAYLHQAWAKAREMVTSLDEIVWAMDPHHDSLSSLVSYFSLYADRFLGLAGIAWRLEGPQGRLDNVVNSRHRYQLFLAFKEALNNIVRHAGATEIRLGFRGGPQELVLTISDNGRGLPEGSRTETMSGIANMRARIERLGGSFKLSGGAKGGVTVEFRVPAS